jgi:predicted permease
VISRLLIFVARLRGLFARQKEERELNDEIRMHLRLLTDQFIARGMSPIDAASAARRQFGNTTLLEEDRRDQRSFRLLEALWRDVRYGARQLHRNPLFTTVAVVTLALGVGANTAVFTLLDQLVLRLLPVKDPARLVMIWSTGPNLGNNNGPRPVSYPMYQDFQRNAEAFEDVICQYDAAQSVTIDGSTERANVEAVSGNYFQALGVAPAIGRVFSPEADDRVYQGHPVVVLSHRYWIDRLGGDPRVLGKKILVNNYPVEIVGVSAAGFAGLDPATSPHMRIPILMLPVLPTDGESLVDRRSQWLHVFARMKPGFTAESARASLQPLFHQILQQEIQEPTLSKVSPYQREQFLKRTVEVETAANGYSDLRQQYSTALIVLMGMAALILLIACSNVASLLIARAAARQKEIAVRLAIGAGRRTLIRSLLVESVLLSAAGAAVGLILSELAARGLLAMLPSEGTLRMLRPQPDMRILLFGVGVALATGLLFGMAPALQGTRLDVWTALKDSGGSLFGGQSSARLRKILVTVQVAVSFLLLAAAGLFAKTLISLKTTDTGLQNIPNVVTFQVDPRGARYTVPQIREFYENALREIQATPGVQSAALAVVPLLHGYEWNGDVPVEGHQAKDGEDMNAANNVLSPGYWRTMGIPILAGRDFDERDRFNGGDRDFTPTVAIVNRKFAEHFFGTQSPIGRHIGSGGPGHKLSIEIVGEVEDALYQSPRQGMQRQVYFAEYQAPVALPATFYVRTARESRAMLPLLRGIVAKLDPTLPVFEMKTLEAQLDETLSTERLIAMLSVVFGVLATVLAALGLYGVMAFAVERRTKEIGLRMALGAAKGSVLWLVLHEVLLLLGTGLLVGIPCAYTFSRYVSSQLFGVTPTDISIYIAAIVILGVVAALSGFVPARRASVIDPLTALRHE